nr:MAG TPA: minor capsid protein [Microviridae sp.]
MLGAIMGVIGAASALQSGSNQSYNEEQAQLRQAQINKEQAKYSQGLAMEYWDYTNWENQVDHLKKAGLNPALMYAKGGTGGQTGGGQAQGVGLSPSNQEAVKAQQIGMALQLAQLKSQIEVNESVAKKNTAEAEKTAGVDTEAAKIGIKLSEAQVLSERERKNVLYWEAEVAQSESVLKEALANTEQFNLQKVQWDIRMVEKGYEELSERVAMLKRENKIGDATAEMQIEQYKANLVDTWAGAMLKMAQTETQKEEVKAIAERLKQKDYELDQKDTEIIQRWVDLGIKGVSEVGELLTGIKKLSHLAKKLNIGK